MSTQVKGTDEEMGRWYLQSLHKYSDGRIEAARNHVARGMTHIEWIGSPDSEDKVSFTYNGKEYIGSWPT